MRTIMSPLAAPPDVESIDNGRHAPVSFNARKVFGSIEICLGPWVIGELQRAEGRLDLYLFIVRLEGLPNAWRRPVPLAEAQDRVVEIVRQWIEATPIPVWLADRSRAVAGDRQGKAKR